LGRCGTLGRRDEVPPNIVFMQFAMIPSQIIQNLLVGVKVEKQTLG